MSILFKKPDFIFAKFMNLPFNWFQAPPMPWMSSMDSPSPQEVCDLPSNQGSPMMRTRMDDVGSQFSSVDLGDGRRQLSP